jgi:hypothetical protein
MNKNFFLDAVTLDPAASLKAWEKLGSSTWPYEIAALPAILHTSLRNRLKKEQNQWQKIDGRK